MKSLEVQARIKHNAEEMQEYLRDMARWENDVRQRDARLRSSGRQAAQTPRVREGGTVKVQSGPVPAPRTSQVRSADKKTAAAHTYDKGYSKWEKFDVDRALDEADRDEQPSIAAAQPPADANVSDGSESREPEMLTPANIVDQRFLQRHVHSVASARGVYTDRDPEDAEREIGNDHFKRGDFQKAVRSYTRCLGMKKGNYLAFSNRAMAYLKLREFDKAEVDASFALAIEPDHVKSLLRRATARTALGKFRAALVDLKTAQQLEPGNKTVAAEIGKAKELLKSAMNRAPAVRIPVAREQAFAEEVEEAKELPVYVTAGRIDEIVTQPQQQDEIPVEVVADESARSEQQREEKPVVDMAEAAAPTSSAAAEKKKNPTKPGAKSAKARDAKPKKRATKGVSGGYDLERSLRIAGHDVAKLTALFTDLRPQDGHKVFAENLEVDVVAEFLLAAARVYAPTDPARVCAWFEAVSRASQFDLIKMLLTAPQKESLAAALRQVKDHVDVERVLAIQRAYELPEP